MDASIETYECLNCGEDGSRVPLQDYQAHNRWHLVNPSVRKIRWWKPEELSPPVSGRTKTP